MPASSITRQKPHRPAQKTGGGFGAQALPRPDLRDTGLHLIGMALMAANLVLATPVRAEPDLGKIVSGIAQSLLNQELERSAFQQAQSQNTATAWRAYLTKFPQGAHRTTAEAALAALDRPPVQISAASTEAALGLTRTQRLQIQTQLTAPGHPTGLADGLWGAKTRAALGQWQAGNGLAATGYITAAQVSLLAQQAGPAVPPAPPVADDRVEESLLGLTYAERREVQSRLATLGYGAGSVDGVFGARTRRSLALWQGDQGQRASGYLTADQLRALRNQTGG